MLGCPSASASSTSDAARARVAKSSGAPARVMGEKSGRASPPRTAGRAKASTSARKRAADVGSSRLPIRRAGGEHLSCRRAGFGRSRWPTIGGPSHRLARRVGRRFPQRPRGRSAAPSRPRATAIPVRMAATNEYSAHQPWLGCGVPAAPAASASRAVLDSTGSTAVGPVGILDQRVAGRPACTPHTGRSDPSRHRGRVRRSCPVPARNRLAPGSADHRSRARSPAPSRRGGTTRRAASCRTSIRTTGRGSACARRARVPAPRRGTRAVAPDPARRIQFNPGSDQRGLAPHAKVADLTPERDRPIGVQGCRARIAAVVRRDRGASV